MARIDWKGVPGTIFALGMLVLFAFVLAACASTTATPERDSTEMRVPIFGGGIERSRTYQQAPAPDPLPTGIDAAMQQADLLSAQGNVVIEAEDLERKQQEKSAVDRMERARRIAEAEDCERRLDITEGLDGKRLTARKCDCWKTAEVTDTFAAAEMCDFAELEALDAPPEPTSAPVSDFGGGPRPVPTPDGPESTQTQKDAYRSLAIRLAPYEWETASRQCRDAMMDALVAWEAYDDEAKRRLIEILLRSGGDVEGIPAAARMYFDQVDVWKCGP